MIAACVLGSCLSAWPIMVTQTTNQETVNAVQDVLIVQLEARVNRNTVTIAELDSKMNWIIGGIAGIYAAMAIIGFINLSLLKGRPR